MSDCGDMENLTNLMMDIRMRQDRIISQQIDLKYDIRAIQCGVDEKIDGFLEEMRAKFLRKMSPEVSRSQIVVYNDSRPTKNKVDGLKKIPSDLNKNILVEDISGKRDGKKDIQSSEVNYSLKAEKVDIDNYQHDNVCNHLDDTFYTEDIMKQVDEIMKSAEKPNQSNSIEIEIEETSIETDEATTEMPIKRKRRPEILTISPVSRRTKDYWRIVTELSF
ncbi:hypothetical protein Adt_41347 [Abeliophyllum distichum]|uniref:Uncharacterized protein n=1 Tax=Abeliophyllum distichum TaxID=126358 RepID=A0ABD1PNL2_9LAMI